MRIYRARSFKGAVHEVRRLRNHVRECHELLERFDKERKMLAKLAAETPQFFNPLDVMEAKKIRDKILNP